MRMILAAAMLIGSLGTAFAQYGYGTRSPYGGGYGSSGTGSNYNSHYVNPYTTSRGTYVQPHHQTSPNSTQYDNYSTRGNYNPYTGTYGTRTPRY